MIIYFMTGKIECMSKVDSKVCLIIYAFIYIDVLVISVLCMSSNQ